VLYGALPSDERDHGGRQADSQDGLGHC